jgi:hypothetical protein
MRVEMGTVTPSHSVLNWHFTSNITGLWSSCTCCSLWIRVDWNNLMKQASQVIPRISCLWGGALCPLHRRLPHDVALRQMTAESTAAAIIQRTLLRRKHKVQFCVWHGNLSSPRVYWFSLLNDTLSVSFCDISSNWAVILMLKKCDSLF